MDPYDYLFKILIIGDSNVGKTCILYKRIYNTLDNRIYEMDHYNYATFIGIDFKTKMIKIKDKTIKLQIWDTAGQERFRTITTAYYRGAMGVIIVFDVTNTKSFKSIREWLQRIKENANKDVDILIMGNKCDSKSEREVTYESAKKLVELYGYRYFDVSALTGENVLDAFLCLAESIKSRMSIKVENDFSESDTVKLKSRHKFDNSKTGKSKGPKCC